MAPTELLADAHTQYDAITVAQAQLEVDVAAARAAYDAVLADAAATQGDRDAAAHVLSLLNGKRPDLVAAKATQIRRGYLACSRLRIVPGQGAGAWLPAPPAWGSGVSFNLEAFANGE